MPVTPMPGPSPVAPTLPVAGLLAQAVQPGLAAGVAPTRDPVDLVSLSPAAVLQRALDAPGLAVQQLGSLLQEVEQIVQLSSRAAPLVMGELAAEVGTVARELGAGVQALLPPPDKVQTPLQLAGAVTLRAIETLALAFRGPWPTGASARLPNASVRPALPGADDPPGELLARMPAPGHDTPLTAPAKKGNPPGDGAGPDLEALPADAGRETQAAARVALRSAADTLGRMQIGLEAVAAPAAAVHPGAALATGPGYDRAWCEAQIALAQAQVARASLAIETLPRAMPVWHRTAALLDQHGIGLMGAPSRHRLPMRIGALLVLLCIATAALWAASQLDLMLARVIAATLLALAGLAWIWRRSAAWRQPRLRIELRR